jgi:NADPH2:quinone reductase
MQAFRMMQVRIDRYGSPEVLQVVQVPDPEPGEGEVAVRTDASGVTFVETLTRAGRDPRPGPWPPLPRVLGNGVAGRVTILGSGVDPSLASRRVVTATGGGGGYADRVVVPAAGVIPIPDEVDAPAAVALLADGRTALALTRAAAIDPTDRVLITAAAGGVGSLLVQLAHAAAGLVVGAAGGERKTSLVHELGATVAVDYNDPGWPDSVRAAAGGIDVAFDGVGGELGRASLELVVPGGRFLAYGMASGTWTETSDAVDRGIRLLPGHTLIRSPEDNRWLIEHALAESAAGRLRPVIGQVFRLSRA